MKVIIQIPCYNEQDTLPQTLRDLPRSLEGVDAIQILVVDDGSRDDTVAVARRCGADFVVSHTRNRGLAAAFGTGVDTAIKLGADIIVNTDADNQYQGADIEQLLQPILRGEADIVIGDRQTWHVGQFSWVKRILQRLGSWAVGRLAGRPIPDAVSGFRAFSRDAALRLNVVTSFSYTIETILQASHKGLAITSVPIRTNGTTRPSRLFRSIPHFLYRSTMTMLRVYTLFHSLTFFIWMSFFFMIGGVLPIVRFLWLFAHGDGEGHMQSLILGGVLFLCGCLALAFGVIADKISVNQRLLESTLEKVRRLESLHLSSSDSRSVRGSGG